MGWFIAIKVADTDNARGGLMPANLAALELDSVDSSKRPARQATSTLGARNGASGTSAGRGG